MNESSSKENDVADEMRACNNHKGFVVVHKDSESCPVCEIIHDNFRMRTQLLTGAKLSGFEIGHLPKYIQEIFKDIANKRKKDKN
jgi:hypothetical protein